MNLALFDLGEALFLYRINWRLWQLWHQYLCKQCNDDELDGKDDIQSIYTER